MFRRVFAPKKVATVSKSIRTPTIMWDAIEKLAKDAGETPNAYIVLILDQFLQLQMEEGKIDAPVIDEKTS